MVKESLSLVQHLRGEREKVLWCKTCNDSFSEVFPFITLFDLHGQLDIGMFHGKPGDSKSREAYIKIDE